MSCRICLDHLRAPVATPCGHLFCGSCITTHIEPSRNAAKTLCPTCRAEFNAVPPNEFVPNRFILPAIRRVHIDDPNGKQLKAKVTKLESRIICLQKEKDMLVEHCENLKGTSEFHAKHARNLKDVVENNLKLRNSVRSKHNTLLGVASPRNTSSYKSEYVQAIRLAQEDPLGCKSIPWLPWSNPANEPFTDRARLSRELGRKQQLYAGLYPAATLATM